MLPDMAETLEEWQEPYTVKTVTRITVDFVDADVVVGRTVQAVVQPAEMEKINPEIIDWSKKYQQIHSPDELLIGEYLVYQGEDYKIVADGDYQRYGFSEVVAEQTKRALLVVTP
jgi:hypothetical protein